MPVNAASATRRIAAISGGTDRQRLETARTMPRAPSSGCRSASRSGRPTTDASASATMREHRRVRGALGHERRDRPLGTRATCRNRGARRRPATRRRGRRPAGPCRGPPAPASLRPACASPASRVKKSPCAPRRAGTWTDETMNTTIAADRSAASEKPARGGAGRARVHHTGSCLPWATNPARVGGSDPAMAGR